MAKTQQQPNDQDPNKSGPLGPVEGDGPVTGADALRGTRPVDENDPDRTAADVQADDKARASAASDENGDNADRQQGLDTDKNRENIRRTVIERVNNLAKNDPTIAALSPEDREKLVDDAMKDLGKDKAKNAIRSIVQDAADAGPERVGDWTTKNRTVESPLASEDQGPDGEGSHDASAGLAANNDAALNAPIDPSRLPIQARPPGGLRRHVRRQLEMAKRTA